MPPGSSLPTRLSYSMSDVLSGNTLHVMDIAHHIHITRRSVNVASHPHSYPLILSLRAHCIFIPRSFTSTLAHRPRQTSTLSEVSSHSSIDFITYSSLNMAPTSARLHQSLSSHYTVYVLFACFLTSGLIDAASYSA